MKFIVSIFLQIEKFDFKNNFKLKMNTDDSQSSNLLNSSLYDFKFAKVSLEIFAFCPILFSTYLVNYFYLA